MTHFQFSNTSFQRLASIVRNGRVRYALHLGSWLLMAAGYVALGLVAALLILPRVSGFQARNVVSGSMEPNVHIHALAVTRPVSGNDVGVGDVILFHAPADANGTSEHPNPILHRIIKVNETGGTRTYETQGDANGKSDDWQVPPANVMGELMVSVPYGGTVSSFAATRAGYFLFVVLPGLMIMVPELVIIFRWIRFGDITGRPAASAATG